MAPQPPSRNGFWQGWVNRVTAALLVLMLAGAAGLFVQVQGHEKEDKVKAVEQVRRIAEEEAKKVEDRLNQRFDRVDTALERIYDEIRNNRDR